MKKLIILLRKFCYLTISLFDMAFRKSNKIIILCYHSISEDDWFYSVSKNNFKSQIEFLLKKYKPLSLSELNLFLEGKKKITVPSFVVTFDDGYQDILKVEPYLSKLGIRPTVFVMSDPKNVRTDLLETDKKLLTYAQIKALYKKGWEIGCHSASHSSLTELKDDELKGEINIAKKNLEKLFSKKVNYFAYPKGKYSNKVIEYVKKSKYKLALSMDDETINASTHKYKIPRIGINGTHSMPEFRVIAFPSVMKFRSLAKSLFGGFYEAA